MPDQIREQITELFIRMERVERALEGKHDLERELASYKDALDVRIAGDGLIEFRGHMYRRID